jgi:hypothetical protein
VAKESSRKGAKKAKEEVIHFAYFAPLRELSGQQIFDH